MAPCATVLSTGVLRSCSNPPQPGIEEVMVLIDLENVDTITYDATNPNEVITDILLKTGTTGFSVEGVGTYPGFTSAISVAENRDTAHAHTLQVMIDSQDVTAQQVYNELTKTRGVMGVVERRTKGDTGDNAFYVIGVKFGLKPSEGSLKSLDDGKTIISLVSPEPLVEPYAPHQLNYGDYATTKAAFDAEFAPASADPAKATKLKDRKPDNYGQSAAV